MLINLEIRQDILKDPKVVEVYTEYIIILCNLTIYSIGKVLKSYVSGKLPRAFKVVPNMDEWEKVCRIWCCLLIIFSC